MEPGTVGQAPKDVSIPAGSTGGQSDGYVEQAKQAAVLAGTAVAGTVTSAAEAVKEAVGGSGDDKGNVAVEAKEKTEEEKALDNKIEDKKKGGAAVEGFLREKSVA